MSILLALVIGLAIGAAGQYMLQKELDTLFMSVMAGVVGSILGLVLFALLDFNTAASALFSLPSFLFCAIGALAAVVVFAAAHQAMERHAESRVNTEDLETETKIAKDPEQKKNEE
jgi:uncharacterized membrane protein YeaQ/YmgE (transglycosylase-associated protein family)